MKILLIEDDIRINGLVVEILKQEGLTCVPVFDGLEAKRLLESGEQYDLIISDILLPEINGLELIKFIRQTNPHVPILMLSALGDTDDKVKGLDLGADDYMVKPFEIRELTARVRALLKRRAAMSYEEPVTLSFADVLMDLKTKTVTRAGQSINLTPKEFNLLQFFLQNPERVLSRNEIAEQVWNTHFDTGTNFIDVYINYLRRKIDKGFDKKLIHTKSGMGFMLKGSD